MSNIIPINVPGITNIKLGVDTESNQLYYNTSGDLISNHIEIKSIQHIFMVNQPQLPQNLKENSIYVLSGNLETYITDDNGIPSGISYQIDQSIDSSSTLNSVPATKAVYDFVTGALETAQPEGVLKSNQENLVSSNFNIKYTEIGEFNDNPFTVSQTILDKDGLHFSYIDDDPERTYITNYTKDGIAIHNNQQGQDEPSRYNTVNINNEQITINQQRTRLYKLWNDIVN